MFKRDTKTTTLKWRLKEKNISIEYSWNFEEHRGTAVVLSSGLREAGSEYSSSDLQVTARLKRRTTAGMKEQLLSSAWVLATETRA